MFLSFSPHDQESQVFSIDEQDITSHGFRSFIVIFLPLKGVHCRSCKDECKLYYRALLWLKMENERIKVDPGK